MGRRALSAVVVLCALAAASGSTASGTTIDPRVARVERGLAQLARAGRLSGAVLVAKNGRPILERAYGKARLRPAAPNRVTTEFNLASLGKPFTAVAIAQLVQAGKLDFDDRVGQYVHELPASIGDTVTIAELLDHTSGLGDFFEHAGYLTLQPKLTSLAAYLPLITDTAPAFTPGSRFLYSNSGYILLGLVVERVSGENYYDYLAQHVFGPAGMKHSGCFRKSALPRAAAVGYTGGSANTSTLPPRGTSAGGCYSTAPDLLRFTQALLEHRLVNARLTAMLTSAKIRAPGGAYGYGFGIRDGTIWHNGGSPGVGAEFDVNRRLGYTVVVLSNRDPETMRPVMDLILNTLRIP
jgi:CubicO group peptidase (beta-lactamase class C family)